MPAIVIQYQLYTAIRNVVVTAVAAMTGGNALDASRVAIVPAFQFTHIDTPMIQIELPGQANLPHADTGVGLVKETFRVAAIVKIVRDQMGHYEFALATPGGQITPFNYINAVRGDGSGTLGLLHNSITSKLVEIITLRGSSPVQTSPLDPSFMYAIDTYRMAYEIDTDTEV